MKLLLPITQNLNLITGLPWEGKGITPQIKSVESNVLNVGLKVITAIKNKVEPEAAEYINKDIQWIFRLLQPVKLLFKTVFVIF